MAGLQHDLTQQIVNVHWESGLAVEFGERDQDAPTTSISRDAPKQKKQNQRLMMGGVG